MRIWEVEGSKIAHVGISIAVVACLAVVHCIEAFYTQMSVILDDEPTEQQINSRLRTH